MSGLCRASQAPVVQVTAHLGDRVVVRDRPWRVIGVQTVTGGALLVELEALDQEEPGSLTVVSPPDEVTTLPSADLAYDERGFVPWSHWRRWHQALAATLKAEAGVLTGCRYGRVQLEAYQLAPALRVLAQPRPSLLVADDVGLGKTVEAGLALLELAARGRAHRVLIVTPAGLLLQWQQEMLDKLGLEFTLIENATGLARVMSDLPAGVSPWDALPRVLTSVDYIKKDTVRKRALRKRWDLVIVDEAHALAESGSPASPYATQRTRLGRALREGSRGLLLLTATPHNGYGHSFRSLIELVEPTAATLRGDKVALQRRISRAMVRRLKAQITRTQPDGPTTPLFPLRQVKPIRVETTPQEAELLAKVASYCSRTAKAARGTDDEDLVTFAMQVIKKRALSSRRALESTLAHRIEALRKEDVREAPPSRAELRDLQADLPLGDAQLDRTSWQLLRSAMPPDEKRRQAELKAVNSIRSLLRKLPSTDPKIEALVAEIESVTADPTEKVIVFTEYLDSLRAIGDRIEQSPSLRGRYKVMKGGMSGPQRLKAQEAFESPEISVLLATDAASEGLNLQRACRRVIHLELPWNPNRLEQRNGRVDRYGQEREPIIRYLFFPGSPEDDILHQLVAKIEEMQQDRVSTPDILGIVQGLDALGAGLVTLDPESPDVKQTSHRLIAMFEDRTAEFVRTVQPLLALARGQTGETKQLRTLLSKAVPLLPDEDGIETLVRSALGGRMIPINGALGLFRLEIPIDLRGPGVKASYPQATFRRSVAVRTKPRDVEFITPLHPLVRAMAAEARRQLLQVYPGAGGFTPQRLAARRVIGHERPSVVVTFLGSLIGVGGVIEERLLAIRLALDGQPVGSPSDALEILASADHPGEVPLPLARTLLGERFPALYERAKACAEADLARRCEQLRAERLCQTELLLVELEADVADRRREIDYEEKHAAGLVEEATGQLRLFPNDPGGSTHFRSQRQAVDSFAQARREELQAHAEVRQAGEPQPLGAVLLVPEGLGA
ncbi:MAG: DEAD/DEAH box helicase [Thermoanaerobaculaceae bacterium]|jgi:superfamily II DNA or RNA helicase|nr:DEAD/DEAH box helicase [Thermoanaerobaculaceae bacterium]